MRIRRENMDKEVRVRLMRDDDREERELRGYVASSLATEMISSLPGSVNAAERPESKTPAERQLEALRQQASQGGQQSWQPENP